MSYPRVVPNAEERSNGPLLPCSSACAGSRSSFPHERRSMAPEGGTLGPVPFSGVLTAEGYEWPDILMIILFSAPC